METLNIIGFIWFAAIIVIAYILNPRRNKMKYIKIMDLKDGWLYEIEGRTASLGIWSATNRTFLVSRYKFGDNFIFPEDHFDAFTMGKDTPNGTVLPLRAIEKAPIDINFYDEAELLAYLNAKREAH